MNPVRDPEGVEIEFLNGLDCLHGRHVVEIGCGNGRLTWRYAPLAGQITAVDPDAERLAGAVAARPQALQTAVSFAQAQAERLPFPARHFECAVLAWSL